MMSQSALSDSNLVVKLGVERLVLRGLGCDSCLESAKLPVGGQCLERVRESQREQSQVFNFHLS